MSKITYLDKVALNEKADIPDINKVKANDMNEIKNVVNGLVKTKKTISDEETYACNYINDVSGKILWTNPNPTNNFGAQTIAIDFSNYDMYEVVFYQSTTRNERELTSGRIRTQKGSVLSYVPNNIFRAWNCTNSNISFENISDNSNLIPAYIIGYKTGLFS